MQQVRIYKQKVCLLAPNRIDKMQTLCKPYTYSKFDYEKVAYFLQCSSRIISLIHIMDCLESPIEIM